MPQKPALTKPVNFNLKRRKKLSEELSVRLRRFSIEKVKKKNKSTVFGSAIVVGRTLMIHFNYVHQHFG